MLSNQHIYRGQLLLPLMQQQAGKPVAEVLADALAAELADAVDHLIAELAEQYGVSEPGLEGLRSFNDQMPEYRMLNNLFQDESSWLNAVFSRLNSDAGSQQTGLIGTSRPKVVMDSLFFDQAIQSLESLADELRQLSANW